MTRDETKEIVMKVDVLYPNWKPENLTLTVDAWWAVLREYPKDVVDAALSTFVTGNDTAFAPAPGQLIGIIRKANTKPLDGMTASEAWDLVYKALSNSSYNNNEEFEKLPELCQKAVGSAANLRSMAIDENFNFGVEKSLFERKYEELQRRQEEYDKIPVSVRELIQGTELKMLEG